MARQKSLGTLRKLLGGQLPGMTRSGRSWSSKLRAMSSGKLREMYKVMGGASGKEEEAAADDDVLTAGLRQLLKGSGSKLEGKLAEMVAWCRDEDIDTRCCIMRLASSLLGRILYAEPHAEAGGDVRRRIGQRGIVFGNLLKVMLRLREPVTPVPHPALEPR